jgi:DNA-binding XRE family transcriptional regulator
MKEGRMSEYRPVYQTWRMVRPSHAHASQQEVGGASHSSGEKARHRLQQLRIANRISIASLAEAVGCDAETLAAYERGDELLNNDTLRRVERHLRPA